jgi:hypothetical protein
MVREAVAREGVEARIRDDDLVHVGGRRIGGARRLGVAPAGLAAVRYAATVDGVPAYFLVLGADEQLVVVFRDGDEWRDVALASRRFGD